MVTGLGFPDSADPVVGVADEDLAAVSLRCTLPAAQLGRMAVGRGLWPGRTLPADCVVNTSLGARRENLANAREALAAASSPGCADAVVSTCRDFQLAMRRELPSAQLEWLRYHHPAVTEAPAAERRVLELQYILA